MLLVQNTLASFSRTACDKSSLHQLHASGAAHTFRESLKTCVVEAYAMLLRGVHRSNVPVQEARKSSDGPKRVSATSLDSQPRLTCSRSTYTMLGIVSSETLMEFKNLNPLANMTKRRKGSVPTISWEEEMVRRW